MLAFFALCLIGLTVAQQPRPCITPSQWEARVHGYNNQQDMVVNGKISYDSVYHRVRIIEDIRFGNNDTLYDILELFQAKLLFVVDGNTGICSRYPITEMWRDFGIQPDARSLGEAYIGTSAIPGAGLLITIWDGNYTRTTNEVVHYLGTWTYEGCLPISHTESISQKGTGQTSFYDVTTGISDPNVFIPPRQCLTEEEYAMRYALFGSPVKTKIH